MVAADAFVTRTSAKMITVIHNAIIQKSFRTK